jgi:hypothetical protein
MHSLHVYHEWRMLTAKVLPARKPCLVAMHVGPPPKRCQIFMSGTAYFCCHVLQATGASSAQSAAGGLIQIRDGKANGIPIWIWILIGMLALCCGLCLAGVLLPPCRQLRPTLPFLPCMHATRPANVCLHQRATTAA